MSFPTNTSPYGSGGLQIPTSPKPKSSGGFGNFATGTGNALSQIGNAASSFFLGDQGRHEQRSTLGPEQQALYQQLQSAGLNRGAGGAFGQAADYYRDLLGNGGQDFDAYAAPQMRQFNEDIVPGLAEQFAGMGSGGLSSSGFRNAAINAGTDLSERLGAMRAQLRQRGAEGLANIGSQGLGNFNENLYIPGKEGFLSQIAPAVGSALGVAGGASLFGGHPMDKILQGRGGKYPSPAGQYNPYTDQTEY